MKIPPILYKYRNFHNSYNKRILFNFEIFLPSTTMFNDPYEGSIPFVYDPKQLTEENLYIKMRALAKERFPDWTETEIDEYCYQAKQKDLLNDPKHMEQMQQENIQKIDAKFRILSLTPKPLNYLMWSHYANCHRGFCIGFDSNDLFDTIGGSLGPVNYQKYIPKMNLFGNALEFHIKQLSTKSDVWDYEEEFRIVKAGGSKETIIYHKNIIRNIVLGCRMLQEKKMKLLTL